MVLKIWSITDRIFSHFGPLLPFYLPKNPENQKFEKMKKIPGDIISQKSTINDNHMMYDSRDMKCDKQNFFVILGYFLHFYPTNNPKNQNFEEMKKRPGDIIILYMCYVLQKL